MLPCRLVGVALHIVLVLLLQIIVILIFPVRAVMKPKMEVVDPAELDQFVAKNRHVIVKFSSNMAERFYGTCFLTGIVFQLFAEANPSVSCARCIDKTKAGVEDAPLFPPMFVYYANGKAVAHRNGYTTGADLTDLIYLSSDDHMEKGRAPKPCKMGNLVPV
eukprot:gb/GFBE01049762.1/.p1 GENE.gb/GFBE01049762.1/~~gb/GFBE01049762.1/.p1  ORF type:complete len:162 (+),score=32.28 gb/GFBE01049762.1/:1-486(+)